jgi:hypothetical protein
MRFKDEDEELEYLANLPSNFCIMKITDERTGLSVDVDQSLDSSCNSSPENMSKFLEDILAIYFNLYDKSYNGMFNNISKVRMNNLIIDFGKISGEKAYTWMMRYAETIAEMLQNNGQINIAEIKAKVKAATASQVNTASEIKEGV